MQILHQKVGEKVELIIKQSEWRMQRGNYFRRQIDLLETFYEIRNPVYKLY